MALSKSPPFNILAITLVNQQGLSHSTLKACLILGVSAANESLSRWCNAPELCFSTEYVVTGYHAWELGKFPDPYLSFQPVPLLKLISAGRSFVSRLFYCLWTMFFKRGLGYHRIVKTAGKQNDGILRVNLPLLLVWRLLLLSNLSSLQRQRAAVLCFIC